MKGYDCEDKPQRPAPKIRTTKASEKNSRKRKHSGNDQLLFHDDLLGENIDFDTAPLSPVNEGSDTDVYKIEVATQTENKSQEEEKRAYFINQATCPKNCYRYTGLTRPKLDLVFEFLEPKATEIYYWRSSKNTKTPPRKRNTNKNSTCVYNEGVLTKREQFILTLVRTRKGLMLNSWLILLVFH